LKKKRFQKILQKKDLTVKKSNIEVFVNRYLEREERVHKSSISESERNNVFIWWGTFV